MLALVTLLAFGKPGQGREELPTPRIDPVVVAEADRILVAGGYGQFRAERRRSFGRLVAAVESYDPLTSFWEKKGSVPASVRQGSPVVVAAGGRIYFMSNRGNAFVSYDPASNSWVDRRFTPEVPGESFRAVRFQETVYLLSEGCRNAACRAFYAYDPVKDSWVKKADMPAGREGFGTMEVGGRLYVVGGEEPVPALRDPNEAPESVERFRRECWAYDPVGDAWSKRAPMPRSCVGCDSTASGTRAYLFGGRFEAGNLRTSPVLGYDSLKDAWMPVPDMPLVRSDYAFVGAEGLLWFMGGRDSHDRALVEVQALDPSDNSWRRKTDMTRPRAGFTLVPWKGSLYAMGGTAYDPFATDSLAPAAIQSSVAVYDPKQDKWKTVLRTGAVSLY